MGPQRWHAVGIAHQQPVPVMQHMDITRSTRCVSQPRDTMSTSMSELFMFRMLR
jgi:hypothetical protein